MNAKKQEPRSVTFRKDREKTWRALEVLIEQAQKKGLTSLSQEDLQALPILYRETIFSLSVARSTALDRSLILYLEALCARAYLTIYGSRRPIRELWRTLFLAVPHAIRKLKLEFFLVFGVFFLGVGVSWTLTHQNPSWFNTFMSSKMSGKRTPWATTKSLRKSLYADVNFSEMLSLFSSYLFSHNTKIGIMAFCLGFFLGIPTLLLIFYNGLSLGAFIAIFHDRGLLFSLLGWLLPHGIPEIGAILLCGAAGMSLGRALLFPGSYTRIDALRRVGPRASIVVAGCFFLFFVAALTEGFFRQMVHNDMLRYSLAVMQLLWLSGWILWVGRFAEGEDEKMLQEFGGIA